MNRMHGSTSIKMKCIWCKKTTHDYLSFDEGIEINVPCCKEHVDEARKFDGIMTAHLRLIKAELKVSENYGIKNEKDGVK